MKLPDYYNIYEHNKYLDKLLFAVKHLASDDLLSPTMMTQMGKENICLSNRKQIKAIQAILIHLDLALEEILNLRSQR